MGRAPLRAQPLQRAARAPASRRTRAGARLDVVFRVFDDGIGFRYEFPEQPQLHDVNIDDELTEFAIAEPAHRVVDPGRRMESLRIPLPPDAAERSRRRRTRRSRSAPTTACTSRSTKPRWSTTRRCGCAGSTAQRLKAVLSPASQGAEGPARRAVRHAVAHAADRRHAPAALYDVRPDPQSQRAERARRRVAGSSRPSTSASGGRCTSTRRPGRPGRSTARRRRTRGATSTSPRRTVFAACWSKAGTSAGTATGSRTARLQLHAAVSRLRPRGARRVREDARACT